MFSIKLSPFCPSTSTISYFNCFQRMYLFKKTKILRMHITSVAHVYYAKRHHHQQELQNWSKCSSTSSHSPHRSKIDSHKTTYFKLTLTMKKKTSKLCSYLILNYNNDCTLKEHKAPKGKVNTGLWLSRNTPPKKLVNLTIH